MKLKNKVALITGGAVGYKDGGDSIGSAIAFKFASEGAKIVVVDLNIEAGKMTTDRLKKDGYDAIFIRADVTKESDVKKVITNINRKYKRLDYLINNAATYEGDIFNNIVNTPEKDWKKVLDVNLNGYYRMAKYAIPLMKKNKSGKIINISSMAAFSVTKNFAVYPVTKAAINALTKVIATDFAPEIRANSICPGFVKIANSENNRSKKELKKWYKDISKKYPMARVCEVDEIANVALFLVSDDSSYINGESIAVDGGKSIFDSHKY